MRTCVCTHIFKDTFKGIITYKANLTVYLKHDFEVTLGLTADAPNEHKASMFLSSYLHW